MPAYRDRKENRNGFMTIEIDNFAGVVKSPIYGVVVFFRHSAYHVYSLAPEKIRRLAPQGHFLRGAYGPYLLSQQRYLRDYHI